MEQEDDRQVDRQPGQVEQRQGTWTREIGADGIEITHGIGPRQAERGQPGPQRGAKHLRGERGFECSGETRGHARAQQFEQREKGVGAGDQHEQRHEGRHRAAGQHAIVDLQHEQRAGQHQEVSGEAHDAKRQQREAGAPQKGADGAFAPGAVRHVSTPSLPVGRLRRSLVSAEPCLNRRAWIAGMLERHGPASRRQEKTPKRSGFGG